MKIVGGKDYYDVEMSYGMDTDVVFVRSKNDIRDLGIYIPGRVNTWSGASSFI